MMPVIFVGHGSPMNCIEENEFSLTWKKIGKLLPTPKTILCISAHWETEGTFVTAMDTPKTIHDFYGFPKELYEIEYPAKGDKNLAQQITKLIKKTKVNLDNSWGLDHGCWSVLRRMYPLANIPIIQLSLDNFKEPKDHFELAKELISLREEGILIIGSGNIIHNLSMIELINNDINTEYGFDWAKKIHDKINKLIIQKDHNKLIDYELLGEEANLAIPTNEHYLPMLYILSLMTKKDKLEFFNDKLIAGSLSMTSFILSENKILD
jgi:4,5-DOPA dioxygenase extradiol